MKKEIMVFILALTVLAEVTADFTANKTPWCKINNNKARFNVRYQRQRPESLLKLYQKLIRLRLEHPELRYGDYKFHCIGENVLAYERVYEKKAALVVINPHGKDQTIRSGDISGTYRNLLDGRIIEIAPQHAIPAGDCYLLEPMEK